MIAWPWPGLMPAWYDVAVIDCPWPWATWSAAGGKKSPSQQYRLMTLDEIRALPVKRLLRPGGCAVIWCTWPHIYSQLCIIEQDWDLRIKTGGDWAKRTINGKLRWGPGHIWRTVCEPYVLAVRGNGHGPRGPSIKNLIETLDATSVDGFARESGRKPDELYSIVERLTPCAWRADVYSRQRRAGWVGFGDELEKFPKESTP
jgi:N6-adenosine-specific RNA methylase IME4